jgi:hypothetical protein
MRPHRGFLIGLLCAVAWLTASPVAVRAQYETTDEEKFRDLTDLDALNEKLKEREKKKDRPPFEMFLTQVAPFDSLPFVKPNHWSLLTVSLRSNDSEYNGWLQSAAEVNGKPQVPLSRMSTAMVFRRDAALPKEQEVVRSFPFLMPRLPSSLQPMILELARPDAIRADASFEAPIQKLAPHQMLVVVLSPDPSTYNSWNSTQATVPASVEHDRATIDRQRYYRLVFPQQPDRPNLSPLSLTWTTISHVVWDGFAPERLSQGPLSQQQAMLDWLHWGGQLVVVASGPGVAALSDSFLGPYLPATPSGRNVSLTTDDLKDLSDEYRPPVWGAEIEFPADYDPARAVGRSRTFPNGMMMPTPGMPPGAVPQEPLVPGRYKPAVPIEPVPERPLSLSGLEPKDEPGIVTYPVGNSAGDLLAVEWRVGRGRVLMLAVSPNDPSLLSWPGLDTFLRRLVFRRPEETWGGDDRTRRAFQLLSGPQLSWVRYAARDLGAGAPESDQDQSQSLPGVPEVSQVMPGELVPSLAPVAAWSDSTSLMPQLARDSLEQASGITIPASSFVLRVILAYIIAIVPLNYLICRYLLRKPEIAWAIAPFLALGFAYGVERAAAYDLGFDSGCDEIDVVEIQGTYPRAHLSRFASLYSTGRERYRIAYPDDPASLALPMLATEALRGESYDYATFEASPVPSLVDYQVQPRSLSMFHAESMVDLGGGIELKGDLDSGTLVNGTDLELRGAMLIDPDSGRKLWLGHVGPWPRTPEQAALKAHEVSLNGLPEQPPEKSDPAEVGWTDLETFLKPLTEYDWKLPADSGELRLVAWVKDPHPGQKMMPSVDRHRGFRLVVAHLKYGMPDPSKAPYYDTSSSEP